MIIGEKIIITLIYLYCGDIFSFSLSQLTCVIQDVTRRPELIRCACQLGVFHSQVSDTFQGGLQVLPRVIGAGILLFSSPLVVK